MFSRVSACAAAIDKNRPATTIMRRRFASQIIRDQCGCAKTGFAVHGEALTNSASFCIFCSSWLVMRGFVSNPGALCGRKNNLMSDSETSLAPGTPEGDKQLVAVLLAQFNTYRTEIQARWAQQATLDNLNITAIGIIAGYYFSASQHASELVLLVIPILSPLLGIIWCDHAINIGKLGRFLEKEIIPALDKRLNYP